MAVDPCGFSRSERKRPGKWKGYMTTGSVETKRCLRRKRIDIPERRHPGTSPILIAILIEGPLLMTFARKKSFIPLLLVLILGAGLGVTLDGVTEDGVFNQDDTYEQLQKLEDAFLLINRQYVEDVDAADLAQEAILAMLKELDPHSSYIDSESMSRVQEDYRGTFGGIGIWFEAPLSDTAKVTSTIPDGPSEAVGLLAGDRMIAVDDTSIFGMASRDIQDLIKGPIGSKVTITVKRPRVSVPIDFVITRATIPLYSVDSSYMLDEQTGYLRIGRFAMTTHQEFVDHVTRLKSEGLERLIIDLRGNPGGIKLTAVQIADEMLTDVGVIVSSEGRNPRENEIDRVTPGGLLTDEPVIILVDESTASGSEIIAGAVQDHDRALIVGRRTFGKGLVQRPFQLRDGSVIQMTVARYFMPSGRLIQTPYTTGELSGYYEEKFADFESATYSPAEYLADIPDSLRFETMNGRDVFGGGGVMPDIVIAPDSTSELNAEVVRVAIRNGYPFLYARHIFDTDGLSMRQRWAQDQSGFMASYEIDDKTWNAFIDHAVESGLKIEETRSEGTISFSMADLSASRPTLEVILKARIAQRLYRSEAWYPVFNTIDPMIISALEFWDHAVSLSETGTLDYNSSEG